MKSQYTLDIALPVVYAPEQFIRSESNALAYDWIQRWPDWPGNALLLQGELGSGKTHLAHLWQQKSQAVFLPAGTHLPSTAAIVENIQTWRDEEALFHLLNHCKLGNIALLITSTLLPDALPFRLPDLRSRLKSLPLACISAPDDALIAAVVAKHFADRQMKVAPDVMNYLLPRLPRSFADIADVMGKLDSESLATGRTLTIPFIRKVLENLA